MLGIHPQLAAYVELIRDLGYHHNRVLFDTPADSGQLDLAIMGDSAAVVVLARPRGSPMDLDRLLAGLTAHVDAEPTFRRGDEPRQLAWRLWRTRAPFYGWWRRGQASVQRRGTPRCGSHRWITY